MPQPTTAAKKQRYKQRHLQKQKKKKMQRLVAWTVVGLLVLFGLFFVIYANVHNNAKSQPAAASAAVNPAIFQYDKQPVEGSSTAPVKIVEFADFKCPVCKQFDQTILPQLTQDFIKTGKVQYYFINDPIISPNADSTTAALAGEAVFHQNPQAFWSFYDAVYANQGDETTTWATSDRLVQIAKQANLPLDYNKLKQDIDQKTYAADVQQDEAIVKKLGVDGTPTLYLNGKEVSIQNTFDYAALKAQIEQAEGAGK